MSTNILKYTIFPSQFGNVTIALLDGILYSLEFHYHGNTTMYSAIEGHTVEWNYIEPNSIEKNSLFREILAKLENNNWDNKLSLGLFGSEFQRKVWNALREIPVGKTMSYKDIAQKIGHPKAYRAVATACKNNPIAYFIPCHRVVPAAHGAGIGEYRYGKDLKKKLLERELNERKI